MHNLTDSVVVVVMAQDDKPVSTVGVHSGEFFHSQSGSDEVLGT